MKDSYLTTRRNLLNFKDKDSSKIKEDLEKIFDEFEEIERGQLKQVTAKPRTTFLDPKSNSEIIRRVRARVNMTDIVHIDGPETIKSHGSQQMFFLPSCIPYIYVFFPTFNCDQV